MEVLLNAFWLLVAIGAFLFWRPEKYRNTPTAHDRNTTFGVLALACALVLLFPVISLTDDLNAEQIPLEDSSRTVMKARSLAQEGLRVGKSLFMALATTVPSSADPLHVLSGSAVLVEIRFRCLAPISAHDGRAPPFHV